MSSDKDREEFLSELVERRRVAGLVTEMLRGIEETGEEIGADRLETYRLAFGAVAHMYAHISIGKLRDDCEPTRYEMYEEVDRIIWNITGKAGGATTVSLNIGKFTVMRFTMDKEKVPERDFWIRNNEHPGEGMATSAEKLEAAIQEFWDREF